MHFQVIKDEYYMTLSKTLKDKVPEFNSLFDDKDGIYPILGDFSSFIIQNIANRTLLYKCWNFINNAIANGSEKTTNAIVVQVFEPLFLDKMLIEKSKPYMSEKTLDIFNVEYEKFKSINV